MKIRSLLVLSLCCMPQLWADMSIVAQGVNYGTGGELVSERFYDVGKGYMWSGGTSTVRQAARDIWDVTRNNDFLGDLVDYIPEGEKEWKLNGNSVEELVKDDQTCWSQVSSNAIQYWQSYYGVFASKDVSDIYGYTYNFDAAALAGYSQAQLLSLLGGTQSLKIAMNSFEQFNNVGGYFYRAAAWYLGGNLNSTAVNAMVKSEYQNQSANGGYYSEYFASERSTYVQTTVSDDINYLRNVLVRALGYTQQSDGTYIQTTQGQIAYLSMDRSSGAAHAITCHGIKLDDAGNLVSLYVTNSDDSAYDLFEIFIKEDGGVLRAYADSRYSNDAGWDYDNTTNWYVVEVDYINTPDSLKNLLASYEAADNKLVWNGKNANWDGVSGGDINVQATDATGWERFATSGSATIANGTVKSDYFNSYYDDARGVAFNDYADSGNVNITAQIATPSIDIDNSTVAYVFTGNGNTVRTESLNKTGSATATWSDVSLETGTWNAQGGVLKFDNSTVKSESGRIQAGATAEWSNATVEATNGVTIEGGGRLQLAGTNVLTGNLVLNTGSVIDKVTGAVSLTIHGDLIVHAGANGAPVNTGSDIATLIVTGKLITMPEQQENLSASMSFAMSSTDSAASCVINANLDLTSVESITLGAGISLNGNNLYLDSSKKMDLTLAYDNVEELYGLALFTDIGNVYVDGVEEKEGSWIGLFELPDELTNGGVYYEDGQFILRAAAIPEPSTVTLSLLALAGLAARRRRKV